MSDSCPDPHHGSFYQNRVCRICGLRIPRLIGPSLRRSPASPAEAEVLLQTWRERQARRLERIRAAQEAARVKKNEREFERASRVLDAKHRAEQQRQQAQLVAQRSESDSVIAPRASRSRSKKKKSPTRHTLRKQTIVAITTSFPKPVPGALPEPVRAPRASPELRQGDCAKQESCLDQAVRAGWRGFSCAKCGGYVQSALDLFTQRNNAELDVYPLKQLTILTDVDNGDDSPE